MTTLANLCGITAVVLLLITGYLIARAWYDLSTTGRERPEWLDKLFRWFE